MTGDRYSVPPTAESLEQSTARLKASNDRIESGLPPVSDEQRLAVCLELVSYRYKHGQTHMDDAMTAYEREAKARIAGRVKGQHA